MRSWVQCLVAPFLSSAIILFYQERFYPGYSPEPGLKVSWSLKPGSCLPSPHTWGMNFVSLFEDTTGTNSPFNPEHKNTGTKGKNRGGMKCLFSNSAWCVIEMLFWKIQIINIFFFVQFLSLKVNM